MEDYKSRTKEAIAWLSVASAPGSDSINSEARGRYFDQQIGAKQPLDAPIAGGNGRGHSEGIPISEEFPARADAVIVGRFISHSVFWSPSHKSIFTEIEINPEAIAKPGPTQGGHYTILIQGGTVLLPANGQKQNAISYGIQQDPYVLQPGTNYMLFLRYHRSGDFYTVRKSWKVQDGALLPNSTLDEQNAKQGTSRRTQQPLSSALSEVSSTHQ